MTAPRRDRWISMGELADLIEIRNEKLVSMTRRERVRHARRLVRRAERRDTERYTKRIGRGLYVSVRAVETLMAWDPEALSEIERQQGELAQEHRDIKRQVNGHGARIRNLEKWRELTTQYLADVSALDGATMEPRRGQKAS